MPEAFLKRCWCSNNHVRELHQQLIQDSATLLLVSRNAKLRTTPIMTEKLHEDVR